MPHQPSIRQRSGRAVVTAFALLACAAGVGLLAVGEAVSFEQARRWFDWWSADGSADAYTRELHGRLRRPAGAGLLVLGVVLLAARRWVVEMVERLAASTVALGRDLRDLLHRLGSDERPAHLITLAAILVTGSALRVALLGWPMRYDESFTFLHYVRYPLALALTTYDAPNNHLFHTFLVHVAYRLFGDAPWALRLPALVAGILTLPVGYLVARRFAGGAAALLATALLATSMVMIEMSTNARGYPIVTLVFLLLLGLGQYLRRRDNAAGWVLFAALGAIGTYTVPTMIYGFATVALWLLLSALAGEISMGRRAFLSRLATAVAGAGVVTAALYATILLQTDLASILASPTVATKVRRLAWGVFLEGNLGKAVDTWHRWTSDWPVVLRVTAVAGVLVAVGRHARVFSGRVPVWVAVLGACVPMLLVQRIVIFSRVWGFLFPWFCVMAAGGLVHVLGWLSGRDRARMERVVLAMALLLLAWQTVTLSRRASQYVYAAATFPDAETVVRFLISRFEPGDRILMLGTSAVPFWYYCERHGLPYIGASADYRPADWGDLAEGQRLFVVVNELGPPVTEQGQTLEGVLETAQLARFARAPRVAWTGTSSVHLIEGRPP